MIRNAEKTIGNLIDKQGASSIAFISEGGFSNMKAMLPPRKWVGVRKFYFITSTSSVQVTQYRENPNASIYFCDRRFLRGMMPVGHMEVPEDATSKEMIWWEGDIIYCLGGVADLDCYVLKLTAQNGRYYTNFHSESFQIKEDQID